MKNNTVHSINVINEDGNWFNCKKSSFVSFPAAELKNTFTPINFSGGDNDDIFSFLSENMAPIPGLGAGFNPLYPEYYRSWAENYGVPEFRPCEIVGEYEVDIMRWRNPNKDNKLYIEKRNEKSALRFREVKTGKFAKPPFKNKNLHQKQKDIKEQVVHGKNLESATLYSVKSTYSKKIGDTTPQAQSGIDIITNNGNDIQGNAYAQAEIRLAEGEFKNGNFSGTGQINAFSGAVAAEVKFDPKVSELQAGVEGSAQLLKIDAQVELDLHICRKDNSDCISQENIMQFSAGAGVSAHAKIGVTENKKGDLRPYASVSLQRGFTHSYYRKTKYKNITRQELENEGKLFFEVDTAAFLLIRQNMHTVLSQKPR